MVDDEILGTFIESPKKTPYPEILVGTFYNITRPKVSEGDPQERQKC